MTIIVHDVARSKDGPLSESFLDVPLNKMVGVLESVEDSIMGLDFTRHIAKTTYMIGGYCHRVESSLRNVV